MIASLPISLGICLSCLLAAAGVRATRSAFTSFTIGDLQRLEAGNENQKRLAELLKSRRNVDTSLLIAHHTATLAFVIALFRALADLGYPPWTAALVAPPVMLVFGELAPRALGRRYRPWLEGGLSGPVYSAYVAFTPLRLPLVGVAQTIARAIFGAQATDEQGLDEAEFLMLLQHSAEVGALEQNERDFVESVFEFDDISVGRLMTPRPDIFSLAVGLPWVDLIEQTRRAGYSRIPLYERRSDDIIGVLLVKDLLRCDPSTSVRERRKLLLPPSFVPANKSAEDMLRDFMAQKHHMSFVVDEHGTLVGLVTIDDLLEALVGDLEEDADDATAPIIRRAADIVTVKAAMEIMDFTQQTGIALPEGDYHTVGGFVFHLLGEVPEPGDLVESDGYRYLIRKMEGRKITEVDVTMLAPPQEEAS